MDNLVNKVIKAKEELDILDAAASVIKKEYCPMSIYFDGVHIWLPSTIYPSIDDAIEKRRTELKEFLNSVEVTNKENKETLWKRIIKTYTAILMKE